MTSNFDNSYTGRNDNTNTTGLTSNNPGYNNTNNTTGMTAGERVAQHIPGTDAHAQRSNSPGAKAASKIPGTGEHRHENYSNDHYTGTDTNMATGRGGAGNIMHGTTGTHGATGTHGVTGTHGTTGTYGTTGTHGTTGYNNNSTGMTAGERVAEHIPGTETHAQRSNSPGANIASKIPGTAEHRHENRTNDHYTGTDTNMATGRAGAGNMHGTTGTTGTHGTHDTHGTHGSHGTTGTGYDTSAGFAGTGHKTSANDTDDNYSSHTGVGHDATHGHGTTGAHNITGATTDHKPGVGDKIRGGAQAAIGKMLHKPEMEQKGIETKTQGTNHGIPYPNTSGSNTYDNDGVAPHS